MTFRITPELTDKGGQSACSGSWGNHKKTPTDKAGVPELTNNILKIN